MIEIKGHYYNIGFATPVEWLNDMLEKYGSYGDYDNFCEALEFAYSLGEEFLIFCDKEQKNEN